MPKQRANPHQDGQGTTYGRKPCSWPACGRSVSVDAAGLVRAHAGPSPLAAPGTFRGKATACIGSWMPSGGVAAVVAYCDGRAKDARTGAAESERLGLSGKWDLARATSYEEVARHFRAQLSGGPAVEDAPSTAASTVEALPDTCRDGGTGLSEDCAACGGITYEWRRVRGVVLGGCRKAKELEAALLAS